MNAHTLFVIGVTVLLAAWGTVTYLVIGFWAVQALEVRGKEAVAVTVTWPLLALLMGALMPAMFLYLLATAPKGLHAPGVIRR